MTYETLTADLTMLKKYGQSQFTLNKTAELTTSSAAIVVQDISNLKTGLEIISIYFALSAATIATITASTKTITLDKNSTFTGTAHVLFYLYTDAEMVALNQTLAKNLMKVEIESNLGIVGYDDLTARIDSLVNNNQTYFQILLAYKQLQLLFLNVITKEDDFEDRLKRRINSEFKDLLKGMPNLKSNYEFAKSIEIKL